MQHVDVRIDGETVVVGIAGHHDGFVQIHHAMAADLPVAVAVAVAGQSEKAGIGDAEVRRALAEFEPHHCHEGLEGRTRWIGAGQRAIVQRSVG